MALPDAPEPEEQCISATYPADPNQLASTILHNLQYQHDWTSLSIQAHSTLTHEALPRSIIFGLPPRPLYIHRDRQVEILKAEHASGQSIEQHPEPEWVLPTHIHEKWSLARFAEVFDALDTIPPMEYEGSGSVGEKWAGRKRQKRVLLATLHDDSTVVYYVMHDGIVKPRQN